MKIEYYGLKRDVDNEKVRKVIEQSVKHLGKWVYLLGIYMKPINEECSKCAYFPCREKCIYKWEI